MTTRIVTVEFHGSTLLAAQRPDGVFVAIKPICDALGIEWRKQRERIMRDPILSEGGTVVGLPSTGGVQETTCLRLDLVHGWLFTLDEDRVKPDVRERVLTFKRECYAVLFRAFHAPETQEAKESEAVALRMVTEARQTFGTRAAGELWFALRLPITPSMAAETRQGELLESAT